MNIFRVGLFENPYLDEAESVRVVGSPEYMRAGFDAQVKSIVLLKNRGVLPLSRRSKVWIPSRIKKSYACWWGMGATKGKLHDPVKDSVVARRFERVRTADEADAAVVFIDSPIGYWGYDIDEVKNGRGNGYYPIPLIYSTYTAVSARPVSLAGGDPFETFTNRTYLGKTVTPLNSCDFDFVRDIRRRIGSKPLILCVNAKSPFVPAEMEPLANALLVGFDVSSQAVLEVVSGAAEPHGRLPFTMPRDMETVERNAEDAPFDLQPYVDSEGNAYDFGFGLKWKGKIK
jgi:beta-glucosidase